MLTPSNGDHGGGGCRKVIATMTVTLLVIAAAAVVDVRHRQRPGQIGVRAHKGVRTSLCEARRR
jgi:hypothetical protein